jgi:hypothetical protein
MRRKPDVPIRALFDGARNLFQARLILLPVQRAAIAAWENVYQHPLLEEGGAGLMPPWGELGPPGSNG